MIARTLAAALAAVALSPAQAEPAKPASQRATVVRDAATGKLRAPTAEEAAELAATPAPSAARSARRAAPVEVQHANGAVSLEVDDSLLMYSVARRNADGSITTECVPGGKAARSLVRKAGPQPAVGRTVQGGGLETQ